MGLEIVKTATGIKLWNTIISVFEPEKFHSFIELLSYIEKKSGIKLDNESIMAWMREYQTAPTEEQFKKGLITISVADILKYGQKVQF